MSQAGEINTINNHPEIATSYVTDSGTAVPAANVLNIKALPSASGKTVYFSGAGNTVQLHLTDASNNVGIGNTALQNIGAASNNLALGYQAGLSYTGTESSNLLLLNQGVAAESNTIRIGTQGSGAGQQNTCYIAGVVGNTVSNAQIVTINSSTGQLGVTSGESFVWSDKSTNFTAASGNGYFISGSCIATLPASPSNGDTIQFFVDGAFTVTVTGNTGQKIKLSTSLSAAAGTAVNTNSGDALEITYRSTNTQWNATAFVGSWTIT